MKTKLLFSLCALLAAALAVPSYASDVPDVSAAAYVVMDADRGDILASGNENTPMLIASTTKIMTALVVIERCDLDEVVTVDPEWTGIEGSSMYLAPGQVLTVRELLYGLMLASGNDAAVALACVAAGSVADFAALMNERAAALGCVNTHFVNPNGLDADGHCSCARDLAVITREAIKSEEFRRIVSSAEKTVGESTYTNHNRLLTECEGVFGVKTGYTEAAGRSLVTACERDGVTLICVTLSDPDDWADHRALYDWAYGLYERTEVLTGAEEWTLPVIGGEAEEVSVLPSEALDVMLREGESALLTVRLPAFVYAGVEAGKAAGEAVVTVGDRQAARVGLVYGGSVERLEAARPTFIDRVRAIFGRGEREIYTLQ